MPTVGGEKSNIQFSNDTITKLASGSLMVANPKILFDGKILGADDTTLLWENVGTGTFTFTGNKVDMAVTAGQYCVRQSRRRIPYFSGYPLLVENTFDNNDVEANVGKRVGAFSSSAVAPYNTSLDGFWLENDGTTYRLKAARLGTETVNVPFEEWDNYNLLSTYNFNNFSAIFFDFLWLGGAGLRVWVCTPDRGWVLGHAATYIGNNQDVICSTPNQPIRYEIYSTTGTGNFRYVCSQASVGGSDLDNLGYGVWSRNAVSIACNSASIIYALQGFRKTAAFRDIVVKLVDIACVNEATTDTGMLMLIRNPVLSAPLTYLPFGKIERAIATTQTITSFDEQNVIAIVPVSQVSNILANDDYKKWFTQTIGDTFDEYVMCYAPASTNQNIRGFSQIKTY